MKNTKFYPLFIGFFLLWGCATESHQHDHVDHDSSAMQQNTLLPGHDAHIHHSEVEQNEMMYSTREHAVAQSSDRGIYKLSLHSNESPVPLQKIHSWTLHVEKVSGESVDDLKIFVFGGMPMHRHGFPTRPKVSEHLGNGDFRIDGIKFNMAGHWEMRFNITEKDQPAGRGEKDRVVFNIHIK